MRHVAEFQGIRKNKQQQKVGSCLELMNERQIVKIEEGRAREAIHKSVKVSSLLPSIRPYQCRTDGCALIYEEV